MSQNWYVKNMSLNEYITGGGNGDYRSLFDLNTPAFVLWVISDKWVGADIRCFPEHEIPGGYNGIMHSNNKTETYKEEFENLHRRK